MTETLGLTATFYHRNSTCLNMGPSITMWVWSLGSADAWGQYYGWLELIEAIPFTLPGIDIWHSPANEIRGDLLWGFWERLSSLTIGRTTPFPGHVSPSCNSLISSSPMGLWWQSVYKNKPKQWAWPNRKLERTREFDDSVKLNFPEC